MNLGETLLGLKVLFTRMKPVTARINLSEVEQLDNINDFFVNVVYNGLYEGKPEVLPDSVSVRTTNNNTFSVNYYHPEENHRSTLQDCGIDFSEIYEKMKYYNFSERSYEWNELEVHISVSNNICKIVLSEL